MKHILSYLKPYLSGMIFGLMIKIIGTFADLGLPYILAHILDQVIPTKKVNLVILWGGLMMLLAVLARSFNIYANRMAAKVARDSVEQIRHDLFKKIFQLSGAQTDAFSIPSLISRMTSDTYNIHQMIGMMQRLGVRAPMIFIGGIIITFSLEPVLTLVLIAVMPLLVVVIVMVSKKGIPLYTQVQHSVDTMVRTLRENISGIRVIKALSKTEYEKRRFYNINHEVSGKEMKAGSIMAITGPCMNLLLNLGLTLVIIVGAYRVNSGASEPGKIVAFLTYFTMILNAVLMINRIFVIYSKASASAARISSVLTAKEDLVQLNAIPVYQDEEYISNDTGVSQLISNDTDVPPLIVFEQISFGYHNNDANTPLKAGQTSQSNDKIFLSDIEFKIKKGESLGIIGATGSGKTTIVNLLMRFYDTTKGNIYIDGKNIKSYPLQELRKKFGVVFQNDMIFSNTIFENIDFGRGLTMESVKEAAHDGQAEAFIAEKQGGYDYVASIKGADFSGGQKQRLYISRALAARPEILIFDDSSSALDYKTDANLRSAIREKYKEATTIMIAQRISSIMHTNHILVLDDGKMLGYGTHEELLKTCEIYQEIYQSQMGQEVDLGAPLHNCVNVLAE